ncbi:ABC transporter ATP-binding protein [Streptomyces aidingensis]|uniref:ATP-binding cassette, subfamily B n=1 Tax=Streptomyces aidingensis TaxID=910347 RepID=A0A1I1P9M5_9ACTN|nr:ABC transporter ATP-binding protein [Streptomyces aidingensis]SFD06282.1 ATP-binding cassette, subfamily B [Streptomyces aidingensis]
MHHDAPRWNPPPKDASHPQPSAQVRRILRLFRPHHGRLGLVALLVGASSLVGVASPFLLREIIDTALPARRTGLLALLALGMIGAAVLSSIFSVLQTLLSTRVGQDVMHELRTRVYSKLQQMPLAFFTRTRTGEVQSRIAGDIGGMQATVTSTATSLVSNITAVVATVVAMLALDWRLTLVSLALLPCFVWVARRVGRERKRIVAQRQKQMAGMAALVTESLSVSGILLGRTMGRADSLTRTFTDESSRLVELEVRSSMAGRWRMATIGMIMGALPPLLYWAAGVMLQFGGQAPSIGTLVAFVTLQQGLLRPAVGLLSTGVEVQASLALFQRIFEYLDLRVDITERADPERIDRAKGVIRFENVSFAYEPGGRPVLSNIDLTVPAGGSLALVGATGAGKSTLGYLVPRIYDATSGRVTLDGVDVRDLDFDSLARAIGVVSQETYLFHATVADNLRFAKPDATDEEIEEAARAAQIHDHIAALPDGYQTLVGERGYRFSGGEKQRLAIARTILRDPPVLILDEATSALDTRTEEAVQRALDALSAGRTTITIAHRLSTIRDADQIVVLHEGRIAERGSHGELLALDGRYAALVRRDARVTAPAPAATAAPSASPAPSASAPETAPLPAAAPAVARTPASAPLDAAR